MDTIGLQLEALSRQKLDAAWEVIVADNGSTDGTASVVEGHRDRLPNLRVVRADDGRGINFARNAAASEARGEILVFCDSDDVVQPGWLQAMIDVMQDSDAAGGSFDLQTLNHPDYWPAWLLRSEQRAPPLPPALNFLPYPIGANCAVRRLLWEKLEGFDEAFAYGGEEVEFFWRVQLAGYGLSYAPDARISYRLPPTTRDAMRRGFAKGRAAAMLYHRFEEHGARFLPFVAIRGWLGLVGRAYRLLGRPAGRHGWLLRAAQHTGRLVGGIQQRRFFF